MKYAFIASQVTAFALGVLCHALEVSVSGYYAWRHRAQAGPSAREQADVALRARIRTAFLAGRGVYGSPRIHATLRAQGLRCGRKRVARLMRAQGLGAGRPRKRKPRTTDSQHTQPVAPNLLARDFTASAPNRKWVADITGISTRSGWLYLAGILDVYSRRAIGYAMDGYRDEQLVETALDMALVTRRPQAGLIHHSDRGSQYSSTGYRGTLEEQGIRMSMSGKGEPYDNARNGELLWHAQGRMRRAPRLPHSRRGPSVHLRVPGSLLQPAAPALVAGLSLADDVRANAGSYLTVSTFHKIGATPSCLSFEVV
jgi:putative transposase